eukprot:m51a1_g4771 putative ura6p (402) ;mRNA; r:21801-23301
MATYQKTLAIFKPDILKNGYTEAVLDRVKKEGFTILDWRVMQLDEHTAGDFYAEHKGKGFYGGLVKYVTSGPVRLLVLAREDAIRAWRSLIGPTNVDDARKQDPQSLRALYGTGGPTMNGFHGSDSVISARREILFFFHNQRVDVGNAGESAHDYLQRTVNPLIVKGLTALCKEKPAEPVVYLANWLLEHNPAKPAVAQPAVEGDQGAPAGQRKYKIKKDIIFVLGGPGSGKGTMCERLADEFSLLHLSAGDLLRQESASGSEEGKMIEQLIREGQLVPQEITIGLLAKAIMQSDKHTALVDGFPRAVEQLVAFEQAAKPCKYCIFFDCGEETMLKRIMKRSETSGRSDDNEIAAKKRFRTFRDQTMPVVERLQADGKLVKIDAESGIETVYKNVRQLFVS